MNGNLQRMNGSCPVSMGAPGAPNDRGCAYRTVPVCRRKWLSSSSPAENAVFRREPLNEQVKQHSPCGCGFFSVRKSFNRESLELAVWHVRQPCSATLRAMNRVPQTFLAIDSSPSLHRLRPSNGRRSMAIRSLDPVRFAANVCASIFSKSLEFIR